MVLTARRRAGLELRTRTSRARSGAPRAEQRASSSRGPRAALRRARSALTAGGAMFRSVPFPPHPSPAALRPPALSAAARPPPQDGGPRPGRHSPPHSPARPGLPALFFSPQLGQRLANRRRVARMRGCSGSGSGPGPGSAGGKAGRRQSGRGRGGSGRPKRGYRNGPREHRRPLPCGFVVDFASRRPVKLVFLLVWERRFPPYLNFESITPRSACTLPKVSVQKLRLRSV